MEERQSKNPLSGGLTVSHVLGELTWLASQSARHAAFNVADLAWFLMPPIALRQFHLFRDGARPVGAALWAFPPPAAEERLSAEMPSPHNKLEQKDWSGGTNLWLVDLIAPFATPQNRQLEVMLGDLLTGPFKGKEFRMLRIDAEKGTPSTAVVATDAGEKLIAGMAATLRAGTAS